MIHWVNSILIYCGESDDAMPMIVFAATHSDYFDQVCKTIHGKLIITFAESFQISY